MWFMLPVVQSVVCLPFVLAIVVPAFTDLSPTPGEAAATLGASPWRVWWTVDLPRVRRSLGAAVGTSFAVGIGEFGAASLLARPARETMPIAIARLAGRPGAMLAGQAAALAVLLAVVTATATLLSLASGAHSRSLVSS
jgi:thiamine transport system permease protein